MKKIDVVGAILIKDKKILCAQRDEGHSLAGLWEFPGGKIEENETPREALMREIKEELQIDVCVEKEAFKYAEYIYDFGQVCLTTYCCQLMDGDVHLTEHQNIKWLYSNELEQLDWAPADIPTVEKLIKIKDEE
ncbi:(deoxy)nucleoside triphosphate pyrophosphohydrolase [Aerococcus suis]